MTTRGSYVHEAYSEILNKCGALYSKLYMNLYTHIGLFHWQAQYLLELQYDFNRWSHLIMGLLSSV